MSTTQAATLDRLIDEYRAWRGHWDAPRPLADEHDPCRCPRCGAKMLRRPWRCPHHGPTSPQYVPEPYNSNLERHLRAEEAEWDPDRTWEELIELLLEERARRPVLRFLRTLRREASPLKASRST